MRIIAERGKGAAYIIAEESELAKEPANIQARILAKGELFPKMALQALLARGYWREYTGDQSILPGLLREAREA